MSIPKYYVDGISKIDPDTRTGIVKLTFKADENGKSQDEVQLIVHVDNLNQAFQKVGEKMQGTFGQGGGRPGGPGGPGGGRRPPAAGRQSGPGGSSLKDLTEK